MVAAATEGALLVRTAADMQALGRRLAGLLRAGDLVLLAGDLGAGKTTLTQGIGAGLGVRAPITSPTFVIARVHPPLGAGPPLVHADAYRLAGWDELEDLDLEASLDQAVTVVEWGTGLVEGLADDRLEITIWRMRGPRGSVSEASAKRAVPWGASHGADAESSEVRTVRIHPVGPRWAGVALPG